MTIWIACRTDVLHVLVWCFQYYFHSGGGVQTMTTWIACRTDVLHVLVWCFQYSFHSGGGVQTMTTWIACNALFSVSWLMSMI